MIAGIKRPRFQRGSLKLTPTGWWLRCRGDDGKETRRFIGYRSQYRTKSAARVAADQLLAELNPGHKVGARSVRIEDFARVFQECSISLMKPSGARSSASVLNKHVVPYFRGTHLEAITLQSQQRFVNHLHTQELSNKTVSNCLIILSRLCALARKFGHPATKIERIDLKMPPGELDRERRYFTPEEAIRIIDAAEMPWRALYALFGYLGIRTGEAFGLCWSHIDFDRCLIHIRQSAVLGAIGTVKSKTSAADLPLPEPLAATLSDYRAAWTPNTTGLLFAREDGSPWNADVIRQRYFAPLLKRLGIEPAGFHAFRHAVATNLLAAGVPIHTAKSLLRHSDIKTTLGYTHTVMDEQRAALNKVALLFTSGTNGDGHV